MRTIVFALVLAFCAVRCAAQAPTPLRPATAAVNAVNTDDQPATDDFSSGAVPQDSKAAGTNPPKENDLPPEVRAALATVDDFSFSYAQPAFYAVLRFVRAGTGAPTSAALPVERWTDLSERSADYRGRLIEIRGIVGRNSAWQHLTPEHAEFGRVWELQIHRDDQPVIIKAILVGDAGDVPVGANVMLSGRFVMMQRFFSESKRERLAALLVGTGPTSVEHVVANASPARGGSAELWIAGASLGLIVAWVILRRSTLRHAATARATEELRASQPAPISLADDLKQWAEQDDPGASRPRR